MAYYPIFLELKNRSCWVIGGGQVAHQKAKSLIRCGAQVNVVAPRLGDRLRRLVRGKKVRWAARSFSPRQLNGADLIIAATDEPKVNEKAAREARRRRIWINVVDCPRLCSFIVPSVVRRGKLALAISTGGVSPALSKWIRKDLQRRYGPEFSRLLKTMARVRPKVLERVPGVERRKRLFEKALKAYFNVVASPAKRDGTMA